MLILVVIAVGFVAFANGANANFKGVASLYGSGTTTLWTAMLWGTFTTLAGSVAAMFVANGMITSFSGKGLVNDGLLASPNFTGAVAIGAALTSILANRLGFPVSTTHALVGALVGAGLAGTGEFVRFSALWQSFVFPLLFSPMLALFLGVVILCLFRSWKLAPEHSNRLLNAAHFATAGAASFSRGLNDTPKMAALLLIVPNVSTSSALLFVGTLIAVGALIDSRRVAETLAKKITGMTPGQGFAANLVTAVLVTTASFHHLPVSTTHVSVGSMLGIGALTKQARWKNVGQIFLAWVTTVPCAGLIAGAAYFLLRVSGVQ